MKTTTFLPAARALAPKGVKDIVRPLRIAGVLAGIVLITAFTLQCRIADPFFSSFLGAVMGSAWLGVFLSALLATLLPVLLVAYYDLPPIDPFSIDDKFCVYQAAFAASAIAGTAISTAQKRAETAVGTARGELVICVRERTAELKKTNQGMPEREGQLRLLIDAILLHPWRANALGEVVDSDLQESAQVSPFETFGAELFSLYPLDDLPLLQSAWVSSRITGEGLTLRLRICDAEEVYRWFFVSEIRQYTAVKTIADWHGVHVNTKNRHREQKDHRAAQGESTHCLRALSSAKIAVSGACELKQSLTALVTQMLVCKHCLCSQLANADQAFCSAVNLTRKSVRCYLYNQERGMEVGLSVCTVE